MVSRLVRDRSLTTRSTARNENARSVSLLRSNADRIAWERTSSRNRITVAASVRLCVGGKFCQSRSFATLMASIITRSEVMEKTHTTLPFRSRIIAQSSTESTSIFIHSPIWHRYPTRPVRIIVGFAAGGGSDITARLMGQWLSERLGQQFVIDNRPAASGNIATEAVVRAPPDGYTLLLFSSSAATNAALYDKLNFI